MHTQSQYEFDSAQDLKIASLAGAMKFCGAFELVIGILYGAFAVFALLAGSIGGVIVYGVSATVWIILAVMQWRAGETFRAVVDTRGSDITLLMAALDHLRGYYGFKRILYILALVLLIVGIVFVVLMMMSRSPQVT
jgi:hypothetical protein